jgi:CheY-like chemotaxis protein
MSAPPLRVMLVDDHQVVRDGIKLLLNDTEDVVVCAEASSAREAVAVGPVWSRNSPGACGIVATRVRRPLRRIYLSSPATRLMVVARMTAPSRYDSRAWRSVAARKAEVCRAVSDTWKVIPTVKAR